MRDPHVASLRYRLVSGAMVRFADPAPVESATEDFRVKVENGVAVFHILKHFSSTEAARAEIDPYVKAWEIRAALELEVAADALKFEFEGTEIIDRDPPPASARLQSVALVGVASLTAVGTATLTKHLPKYPGPPTGFVASPNVETLWHRWEGYQKGREPLQAMAYFCLTVIEGRGGPSGGRRKAAKRLAVSFEVLQKIGDLTRSERGDPKTARKFAPKAVPLTASEEGWLEAAVKKLIWRLAEVDARFGDASSLPQLRMSDLPPL